MNEELTAATMTAIHICTKHHDFHGCNYRQPRLIGSEIYEMRWSQNMRLGSLCHLHRSHLDDILVTLLVRRGTRDALDSFCSLEHGTATYISLPESAGQVLPCHRKPACAHEMSVFETVAHTIFAKSNQRESQA